VEFRCQNEVMCGYQEMWSKTEYDKMIWNRVEHIGKIKDVAECRSSGSRDQSHVVWLPIALTYRICHDAQYRDT